VVEALWNTGIRVIQGDIVGDDSFFTGPERETAGVSDPKNQRPYNAKTGALSLNFNVITVQIEPGEQSGDKVRVMLAPPTQYITLVNQATTTRGNSTTLAVDRLPLEGGDQLVIEGKMGREAAPQTFYRNVSHPALFTITVLREFMERYGIRVQGKSRAGKVPSDASLLVNHRSKPLSQILLGLNKFSNNFIAEQIMKTLGAQGKGPPGSFEKGIAVLEETLADLGLARGTYKLVDGSGLSRLNRVTPSQTVSLLETMYRQFPLGIEYLASLGVMGVDGSVDDRLQQSPAMRKMRVKTGSLNEVSALSGYAETASGEMVAFAIFMNRFSCGLYDAMALQDQMALLLVNFTR
jgi:D-alanyl-D-alanine carboxypeptidase/D-alanyl-D-alanine-endopeptidase (penicillin-binding protein 4)